LEELNVLVDEALPDMPGRSHSTICRPGKASDDWRRLVLVTSVTK
jgi:hypothetical protein